MGEKYARAPDSAFPMHWRQQRVTIPMDFEERTAIAAMFHLQLSEILEQAGIPILGSSFRAKTDESIDKKILVRRRPNRRKPLPDIYGVRLILPDEEAIERAITALLVYYNIPDEYPWGLPSLIDHNDPEQKTIDSDSDYKAIHVYIPFGEGKICRIGEAQLLTPEWWEIAQKTREGYEKRKFKK